MDILYAHLRNCVEKESPDQMIERLRKLFIEGRGYPDIDVEMAVYKMVLSDTQQSEFKYILNRCCHILINYWHVHPQRRSACRDLVALFHEVPATTTLSFIVCRLHELVRQFIVSEEYQTLEHLIETIESRSSIQILPGSVNAKSYFKKVINHYPFLYDCHFTSESSSDEEFLNVRQLQFQRQQDFEVKLYEYLQIHVRNIRFLEDEEDLNNPTQLNSEELQIALDKFRRRDGVVPYQRESRQFLRDVQGKNYQDFKQELGSYLLAEIPELQCQKFVNNLRSFLENLFTEQHSTPWHERLLVETCQKLVDFLIPTPQDPDALRFYILVNHNQIQSVGIINLLLKILFLTGRVFNHLKLLREYLVERIYLWLQHFQNLQNQQWLVKFLDYLQVAFTLLFRSRDTVVNQWIEERLTLA